MNIEFVYHDLDLNVYFCFTKQLISLKTFLENFIEKKNFNLILENYFNIFMNGSSDKLFKYGGPQSSKTQK